MKGLLFFAVIAVALSAPYFARAAYSNLNENVWNPNILGGPLVVCGAPLLFTKDSNGNATTTPNPNGCQNLCDFIAQAVQVAYYIMAVGIWIIIPIMFAWGAIKLMISQGEPAKVSEARKIMTGALVGVVIMLCAYLLVSAFIGFFGLKNIGGFSTSFICTIK